MESTRESILCEWTNLENFIEDEVPISLKFILWQCGYDSMYSVKQISSEKVIQMEKFIDQNRKHIMNIIDSDDIKKDSAIAEYKRQKSFEFLPAHRDILLNLPNNIKNMQINAKSQASVNNVAEFEVCITDNTVEFSNEYSVVLSELLKSANQNKNKSKHAYQYNDIVKYFATYIFLLCGRTCYETLNKNLPIPSTKTICKYNHIILTTTYIKSMLNISLKIH